MDIITLGLYAIYGTVAVALVHEARLYLVKRAAVKAAPKPPPGQIKLPDSILDLLMSMEQGLQIQVDSIKKACEQKGEDPMKDTGYNTVLKQYQDTIKWRERFESNTVFMLVDQIGWPIIKSVVPDAVGAAKRLLKSV
jgi:hypothetical protein